jgi:hypothetical protein
MSGGQPLCGNRDLDPRDGILAICHTHHQHQHFLSISIIPKSITPMLAIPELHREEEEEEAPYLRNRYSKYSCPIKTAVHLFHLRGIIASSLLVVETKRKATTRKQRARCQRSPAFQSAQYYPLPIDASELFRSARIQ